MPGPSSVFAWAGIVEGFAAPVRGLSYLNRNPRLWRYAAWPLAINLAISLLILAGIGYAGWWVAPQVAAWFPAGWWGGILKFFAWVVLFGLACVAAVIGWLVLGGILGSYFNSLLARQVELQLGTPPEQLFELSIPLQVVDVLRDLASLLGVTLVCLAIGLIPFVGPPLGTALALYFDSFILGVQFLDYPLALRALRRADKLAFARRNRPQTLGLGGAVLLLSLLPLVGPLLLTTAAVGSVLLHQSLHERRRSLTAS